jgi:glycosyltransferase involved in cell wall biosynthesis
VSGRQGPKVLLLSGYDARSHQHWHQQLTAGLEHINWTVLSLKDRHFAWRMGGNALTFKAAHDTTLSQSFDRVVATSMTDLVTLRAWYPQLTQVANLLYFHENQFAYPVNHRQQGLLEIQLRSILNALAADQLAFNSQHNRQSFLLGVEQFCQRMPDGIPSGLTQQLADKSVVLPVPISDDCVPDPQKQSTQPLQIVWNHRWEHDKGPGTLLALMQLCANHPVGQTFRFHVLGQQFRKTPAAMQHILDHHAAQCEHIGHVADHHAYLQVLRHADVVLSTATHDFQGLALLEAVACGCTPVVPDRLAYPEYYPTQNRYRSKPDAPKEEARAIFEKLLALPAEPVSVEPLKWQQLKPRYKQWLS